MNPTLQQAVHIFRKDVRYLYREGCFLAALLLAFPVWQAVDSRGQETAWVLELVIAALAAFTVVRAIQAESIVGDSQFWITRPYDWKSLLAAKIIFILAFVNLPVLVVQIIMLGAGGFPIFSNWAGILWSQVLMIFAVELPIAGVASLTRGMIASTAGALVVGLIVAGVETQTNRFPEPFDWLRYSIVLLAAALIAPPLLYLQYQHRRTLFNRLWALGAAAVGLAAFWCMPWSALFAVQSQFSRRQFDLRFEREPDAPLVLRVQAMQELYIVLPMKMNRLPPGYRLEFEDFVVTLRSPHGRTMTLSEGQLVKDYQEDEKLGILGHAPLDPAFYSDAADRHISLHATFYVTVIGNALGRSFSVTDTPRDVGGGLQCYADGVGDLVCRSAFRLPASLAESRNRNSGREWDEKNLFKHSVSYSPFPAVLSINPIALSEPFYMPPNSAEANVVTEEPLAFLRRELEISNLAFWTRESPEAAPNAPDYHEPLGFHAQ